MSDKPKEQDDTQNKAQKRTSESDDAFDSSWRTHSAPSSKRAPDEDSYQQGSSSISGTQQDVKTSGVATSKTFLQEASSSSSLTEERGNAEILGPPDRKDSQLDPSQESLESCSNRQNMKKLILDTNIQHEPSEGYHRGGFCPIAIGDVLNSEFVIIKKLGHGGFSTVWMAVSRTTSKSVALKITKSGERFKAMAEVELNFLEICTIANPNAMGSNHVVRILSSFSHTTENGVHLVMAFEMYGPSLYNILHHSNQRSIHMEQVRRVCRQLLEAVSFLHDECGIIHSDIKPENIMVVVSDEDVKKLDPTHPGHDKSNASFNVDLTHPDSAINIKLCDLGVSCWADNPRNPLLQSCSFRAPEVFLNGKTGTAADMWSVGCVAFEIVTGTSLFSCSNTNIETDEAMNHLSQMSETIGIIPLAPYQNEQNTVFLRNFFTPDGRFIKKTSFDPNRLLNKIRGHRYMAPKDQEQCTEFISSCLKLDPKERPTAKQALSHPFLLPFGGNAPSSVERENFSDDIYPHGHQNVADTSLGSVTPVPNGPSSPFQRPDLSGSQKGNNSGSESSIVTVVETSAYKSKALSSAPSDLQRKHSNHSESPSP